MKDNFECSKCKSSFFIEKYKIVFKDNKSVFKTDRNKDIICPECQSNDISDIKRKNGYGSFMSFSSKTPAEKAEILKKRANKHAQTTVEKGRREHLDRNFKGISKSSDL